LSSILFPGYRRGDPHLAEDGEFEIVLAETMRILSGAYRTR
jgi:hypothetical protein